MIVSIHQPAYLPWLGYIHRWAVSDLHIVLDHVQFEKNSFCNRNKIRTPSGWNWLTVPVKTKGQFGALALNRIEIVDDHRWRKKHWQSLKQSYARAPFFDRHAPQLETFFQRKYVRLIDVNRETTKYLAEQLGISTPVVFSSELNARGAKSELVVNLCREVGASVYLSGPLGRDYLDLAAFSKAGIRVDWHDFRHPRYAQVHGEFIACMAAVDLLLNCGPHSRAVLFGADRGAEAA